jgi:hypothetical protein
MNPILQAMSAGYGSKKILSYISQSNPGVAKKIETALAVGYPAESILRYVMKGAGSLIPGMSNSTSEQNSLYDKLQYSSPQEEKIIGRAAVGIGGAMAGIGAVNILSDIGNEVENLQPEDLKEPKIQKQEQVKEPEKPQSLFRRLVGDIDFSQLDERTTKELSFFEKIASQLEKKGKDEKDPTVKNLKKKIDKALKGISGITGEALQQMPPEEMPIMGGQPAPGQQPIQQPQGQQPGPGPFEQKLSQSIQQGLMKLEELAKRRGM